MSQPTITKLEKSRVEIKAVVPAAKFDSYKQKALESIGKVAKIDGFRPGHIPANVVEKHVGDAGILDEMAQIAIMDAYPTILAENKIDAIGRPEIQITKIAMGNDLEFTATTAVLPTVELADYKKIAKESNKSEAEVSVDETEINAALTELRQMRAHNELHELGVEHHDHDHTKISEESLPELTDDFVKTLGKFEGIEDFKTKLRENLLKEKQAKEVEKKRVVLIDGIIDGSTIDLPDMLVDFELDKMMQQFAHDISMMGMTMDDYMKRIEKSEADLKKDWYENAVKRAKMQLILDEIATKEKLAPTDDEIQAEVAKIMDMYKDAKDISEDRARAYVMQILTNAKAFEYLEGLK
jgi:FKBP-type peptidyl-prolyl cis-trans isomerase (trigger factor)